jgi:hypothetical protein
LRTQINRALLASLPVVNVSHSALGKTALVDELEPHHPLRLRKHRKAAPEDHRWMRNR